MCSRVSGRRVLEEADGWASARSGVWTRRVAAWRFGGEAVSPTTVARRSETTTPGIDVTGACTGCSGALAATRGAVGVAPHTRLRVSRAVPEEPPCTGRHPEGPTHRTLRRLEDSCTSGYRGKMQAWGLLLGMLVLFLCLAKASSQLCEHNPKVSNVSAVLGVQGTVLDPSFQQGDVIVPGPQPIVKHVGADLRREKYTIMVGSTLILNISASWDEPYSTQNLSLYAYEDPGVPNGATLTAQECLGDICNPVVRRFSWSPRLGQAGIVHTMCFLVLPLPAVVGPSYTQCQSDYKCIDMEVVAPAMEWVRGPTPLAMQKYHSPVGCHLTLCFEALDTGRLYAVDITPVTEKLPPGATFDGACAAVPTSQTQLSLFPEVDLETVSLSAIAPVLYEPSACKRCMRWEAPRGGETQEFKPCFVARDAFNLREIETCVHIAVPKCKYCVQSGDTLHFINKRYRLNSNWLQLWNANGINEIESDPLAPATVFGDPDSISNGYSIINLGPVYRVQKGEDLVNLAYLFRTTAKKLLDVNPDIPTPESLVAGMDLCVMPCTDAPFIYNDNPGGV